MKSSAASPKSVTFAAQLHILHIESRKRTPTGPLNREKQLFEKYEETRSLRACFKKPHSSSVATMAFGANTLHKW